LSDLHIPSLLFPTENALRRFEEAFRGRIGAPIDYRLEISSTQDIVRQAADSGAPHGFVCVAEHQTGGRGRRGRKWDAPPASSLLFSILVRSLPAAAIGWVGLAAACAVAHSLRKIAGLDARAKWPNDVVVAGRSAGAASGSAASAGCRKIAGILAESVWKGCEPAYTVLGLGINVLQSQELLPPSPRMPATSILMETGGTGTERLRLFEEILTRLNGPIASLAAGGSALASERSRIAREMDSWWSGAMLEVKSASGEFRGTFGGLDDRGALRLVMPGGGERTFSEAESVSPCGT
jgi:BirA family biotin operon repressor/biotin-[acetyl-CoA-carboxylase] ligase